jgi:hypothetical protein
MAINAHLPQKYKFYDFSKTIPDYDFFTPEPEKDCDELIRLLNKGKFDNVAKRFGVHEGTYKIYVNYHGVADITSMIPWFYNKLESSSIIDDKIHYVDANFLRMAMYLELSRPRGEVERWDKVYKRLILLNLIQPVSKTTCKKELKPVVVINKDVYKNLIKYAIDNSFIFAGAEIADIYKKQISRATFIFKSNYPLIFYIETPQFHLNKIRQLINSIESIDLTIVHWKGLKEIVPEMYGFKINGKLSIIIIEQNYCHSYNEVTISKYGKLKIVSLDTAINLFYTLSYLRNLDELVPNSVECFAHELVKISKETRDKNKSKTFPLFSTTCQGHQPTKQTLLKTRAQRIKNEKQKLKKTRKIHSKHN